MKKKLLIGFTLMVLLLMTGCQQKLSLNFYSKERWKIKAEVDFDADVFQDLGSAAGSIIGDSFNFNVPGGIFNPEIYLRPIMTYLKKNLRNYGIDFNWKYNRKVLKYDMAGDSYRIFRESQMITDLGDGTYRLDINYKELTEDVGSEFDSMMDIAEDLFVDNIVEISVGKIYECNADKIIGSKAIWYNPQHIYIVFRPGSGGAILKLLLWVIGIVLALVVLFAISKGLRRKTCHSCGRKVKLSAVECPHCGAYFGD